MNDKICLNYKRDPLWNRIVQYSPDDKEAAFPFSSKLAAQQKWSQEYTQRAIVEYKRFIYLCCISPHGASPPDAVDEVWHLHLTYTVEYWQRFCRDTLQKDIHHHPSKGGGGEKEKHKQWYADTLLLYEQTFGNAPPGDIWSPPPKPASTNNTGKFYFFEAGNKKRFLLLLIPFIVITILFHQPFPFSLPGSCFLLFYFLFSISIAINIRISVRAKIALLNDILFSASDKMNKYELAYLAGGRERHMLMCISDLAEKGYIEDQENGKYSVRHTTDDHSSNPLLPYIAGIDPAIQLSIKDLVTYLPDACDNLDAKYGQLKNNYDKMLNNTLLPLFLLITGVARCMQGATNNRPIDYLLATIVAAMCIILMLLKEGKFENSVQEALDKNPSLTAHIDESISRDAIINGHSALAGISVYTNIYDYYSTPSGNGDSSSGCGGGGGCGGGCGGCGG